MTARVTVPELRNRKVARGSDPISALTAYDYSIARILDESGVDCILVGDSLGSIIQGADNTLAVTLDEVVYHTRCVSRGCARCLLIADLPFLSYQVSNEQALLSAGRLLKEGGAAAVKLEGGVVVAERIATLTRFDIPVVGHVGLTPQSFHRMGGHRQQGNNRAGSTSAQHVIDDALAVQDAGAFAVVLEGIPAKLARQITETLTIPTIGIAAGDSCDGQILVSNDLFGLNPQGVPPFVTPLLNLHEEITKAVKIFRGSILNDASSTLVNES